MTKGISRTIVSTDSTEIQRISKKYGAETPFIRPAEFARDDSTDTHVVRHAIDWIRKNEGELPDLIVFLRPTTPGRKPEEIERAIALVKARPRATSLRSLHELSEPPQKMMQIGDGGFLTGFFSDDPRPEYYNLPRQCFSQAYWPNGYVDILRTKFVEKENALYGNKALGFNTSAVTEVDTMRDIEYLEYEMEKKNNPVFQYLQSVFSPEG